MTSKSAFLIVTAALAGCMHQPSPVPEAGIAPVNVPVVSRADFAFDAAAPKGSLPASEAGRLEGWFAGMGLRYGDTIYVDGPYADGARAQIAEIAGRYGMMVSPGAPVTPGAVAPGTVRVVVSRTVASVPNCPNWERPSQPNYNNKSMPGLGCSVNSNLAAMIANPEDLVHGREGVGILDTATAAKAVNTYRSMAPTGNGALPAISTKSGG
jgi:pilus assembly protein CpaD